MIAFTQTSEPAIESVPTEAEAEEVNASPTGDDMSEETEPPARSAIPQKLRSKSSATSTNSGANRWTTGTPTSTAYSLSSP